MNYQNDKLLNFKIENKAFCQIEITIVCRKLILVSIGFRAVPKAVLQISHFSWTRLFDLYLFFFWKEKMYK